MQGISTTHVNVASALVCFPTALASEQTTLQVNPIKPRAANVIVRIYRLAGR